MARSLSRSRSLVLMVAALVALAGAARAAGWLAAGTPGRSLASSCPTGFTHEREGGRGTRDAGRKRRVAERSNRGARSGAGPAAGLFAGPSGEPGVGGEHRAQASCVHLGHPESFADLAAVNGARVSRTVAPGTQIRTGAYAHAIAQKDALQLRDAPAEAAAPWTPYGQDPLIANDKTLDNPSDPGSQGGESGSTSEGFVNLSGRTSDFASGGGSVLYAAISNGGVWKSDDLGGHWRSVGEGIPTQVVSSIVRSSAGGGTLIALTGDNAFGGDTYAGIGVWRSIDDGQTWQKAAGAPDGVLGFKLALDPTDPSVVYAATGAGLFRSANAGQSFTNVNLPTGDGASDGTRANCTGKPPSVKDCFLANMVTDVVVQGANDNGKTPGGKPGSVMAAVGWRAGQKTNPDGYQQSPNNGIYVSPDGAPGSFQNVDLPGHTAAGATDPPSQTRLGRIALGVASGAQQNHEVVYAVIQDAVKFNGGLSTLDANDEPTGLGGVAQSDYLNGVYISKDFGQSWTQLEGSSVFDNDTTSGSALAPPTCKAPLLIGYCPGIQAWYNLWIKPDPTVQDAAGVPARLNFGLEEVWGNDLGTAVDGTPTVRPFRVIGRYFAGDSCTLLTATNGLPKCPTNPDNAATTTHPDQHAALYVPDGSGGVTLVVGNDGGVYTQHAAKDANFSNANWGGGANDALHTLQPYDAEMAKDGTVYAGLQDNGEMRITPDGIEKTVFGGDGFFTAVDPDNAKTAYEEYVAGAASVTKDGGKTWRSIDPLLTSARFSTPFQMDPTDAKHLMIGGRDIKETVSGADTTTPGTDPSTDWKPVYDLGTRKHPGDASATSANDDPDNQLSAVDLQGDDAYVGFCGYCDTITQGTPFGNGIATNVGSGAAPSKRMTGDGWHIAKAAGLRSRYITSIRIDPANPRTVYVTLAGYARRWAFPGAVGDDTSKVGKGHVFKSTDAGESFTDISGDMPDIPADWSLVHAGHLVVGTDIGVFESSDANGGSYGVLGRGLPTTPISTLRLKPGDPNLMVAATYGRGVYTYRFPSAGAPGGAAGTGGTSGATGGAGGSGAGGSGTGPRACIATSGFRRASVARSGAHGVRFSFTRKVRQPVSISVFQEARGRRLTGSRLVAVFRNRSRSFAWTGRANRRHQQVFDGYYEARYRIPTGPGRSEVRRFVLRRSHGRFARRRDDYRRATCQTLRVYWLRHAVFGGRRSGALGVTYRLGATARVGVEVLRGRRVVRSYRTRTQRGGRGYVLGVSPRRLRAGDYSFRITVRRGRERIVASAVARRL